MAFTTHLTGLPFIWFIIRGCGWGENGCRCSLLFSFFAHPLSSPLLFIRIPVCFTTSLHWHCWKYMGQKEEANLSFWQMSKAIDTTLRQLLPLYYCCCCWRSKVLWYITQSILIDECPLSRQRDDDWWGRSLPIVSITTRDSSTSSPTNSQLSLLDTFRPSTNWGD